MRYLSVCSGIEAATVAWHPLGWTPIAFSEIEKFPSAVLAHHYPDTPNLGDMTQHEQWNLGPGSVDLLVGGTPCQSFSVAGLRRGLADPRGNLALTYLAIADRLRPRWLVWENVPGVLSSSGGRDFGSFLGALGELGYGFAYRVLDAQYHGVAQRRRRVFLVGHASDWRRAAAVLFERESLRGDPAPSREARKEVAGTLAARTGECRNNHEHLIGQWWDGSDCASTLTKEGAGGNQRMPDKDNFGAVLSPVAIQGNLIGRDAGGPHGVGASDEGAMYTLTKADVHRVAVPIQDGRDIDKRQNGIGVGQNGDPAYTLDQTGSQAVAHPVPYDLFQITAPANRQNRKPGDPCHTLARDNAAHAAVAMVNMGGDKGGASIAMDGTSFTLSTREPHAVAFHPTQDPISSTEVCHSISSGNGQGCATAAVAIETLQQQGYDSPYASINETDAAATLRALRSEIGEEAFAVWGLGVLDSLQSSQVLRSSMHGAGIRCTAFTRSWPVYCAISREEDRSKGAVQSVREACGDRCASSRRQLPQQLARELGAYLSELSQPGPQAERLMCDLWFASEGIGSLRQALSAETEARRPTQGASQPTPMTMAVRRLTPVECEFLMGYPRGYTAIPWRGKPATECPDGPRYRALGNSMAVPCMRWIGERIAQVDALPQPM